MAENTQPATSKTLVLRVTRRLKTLLFAAAVLMLALFWLSAYSGYLIGMGDAAKARAKNSELEADLLVSINSERNARQRATRAEKTAEIDRLAAEKVRQALLAYRREVADLQTDLEFYRRLMAPDELDKGLGLYDFKLTFDSEAKQYRYTAMVTQAGEQNQVVRGQLSIYLLARPIVDLADDLAGDLWGDAPGGDLPENDRANADAVLGESELQRISVADLPAFSGDNPAKLRFRFFQNVEGVFKLPDNLSPVSMVVEVKAAGKSPQQLVTTHQWHQLIGER